jgi:diacylglycerol kinase
VKNREQEIGSREQNKSNHSTLEPINLSTTNNRVKFILRKLGMGVKVSKYKAPGFAGTYRNALKGVRLALKSEKNVRVHFVIALMVMSSGLVLKFTPIEFSILLIAIAIVVIAEMVNSAIEFSLDAIFHNRYSKLVGMAKDIAAGSVMIATFISLAIGILLFGSKIIIFLGW